MNHAQFLPAIIILIMYVELIIITMMVAGDVYRLLMFEFLTILIFLRLFEEKSKNKSKIANERIQNRKRIKIAE